MNDLLNILERLLRCGNQKILIFISLFEASQTALFNNDTIRFLGAFRPSGLSNIFLLFFQP
jgi:hypothetical protein